MENRFRFTTATLEAITAPERGRSYVYDTACAGLAFCVTANDARTFYRCGRLGGQFKRIPLGKYGRMTIDQARKAATKINAEVADGKNPVVSVKKFQALYDWYMKHHSRPRKRSWRKDEMTYANHLAVWANKRLSTITKVMVEELHSEIGESTGRGAANTMLKLLRSMFDKAVSFDWLTKNPAKDVEYFEEQDRERFLKADELPRFFAALARVQRDTTRDFFITALFTGARRSNVLTMRWDDVLLEQRLWLIPASEFKTKRAQSVALSPEVVELLRRRLADRKPDCPWVFPGHGKAGHLHPPKGAWKKLKKDSGLSDIRVHDLRRTLASWQAATGANLLVIGKTLGHASSASTQIYARLQMDPVHEAVDKATSAISEAAKRNPEIDEKISENG